MEKSYNTVLFKFLFSSFVVFMSFLAVVVAADVGHCDGYVDLTSSEPDEWNMVFSSSGAFYDTYYQEHWRITGEDGWVSFAFTGKADFAAHLLGSTRGGVSYCHVALYINGAEYQSDEFVDKDWAWFEIPASQFSDSANTVKIVWLGTTHLWIDRAQVATVDVDDRCAYIPHITGNDPQWTDYLQVNNIGTGDSEFTLTLYGVDGSIGYSRDHTIGSLKRDVILLKSLYSGGMCGKIEYADDRLMFRITHEFALKGGIAEFKLDGRLDNDLVFLYTDATTTFACAAKGLALSNFGDHSLDIVLTALGDGTFHKSVIVSLESGKKLIGTHQTWFPDLPLDQLTSIRATTTSPFISGIAISGNADSSRLLFTPGAGLE